MYVIKAMSGLYQSSSNKTVMTGFPRNVTSVDIVWSVLDCDRLGIWWLELTLVSKVCQLPFSSNESWGLGFKI